MNRHEPNSGNEVTLSIVLPSYENADLIERHATMLLAYLHRLGVRHEVIVSDDGSRDGGRTRKVAEALGCRYVANQRNMGKGAAVRRGMLAARGRFCIFTDADVPYELETIERFLWYLDFKEFHIVVGDRTLEKSSYFVAVPLLRQLCSHVFSFIVGRFVAGGWFDTQCGIKGFRAEVAKALFSVARVNRFAFDIELFYIALKRNYDIKRLPVRLRCQEGSSVRVVRDGLAMLRDLGRIYWHQLVGHYRPRGRVLRGLDSSPFGQRPEGSAAEETMPVQVGQP